MNAARKYSIAWKGLSEGEHTFDFEAGDDLFRLFENTEIKGGHCDVKVNLLRAARQLRLEISIRGSVVVECDRCLGDCSVPIDYEGELLVKFSDEVREYDGDTLWLSPSEDFVDLTQYIYESIVLSLPYQRVHPDGECDPDMLGHRFRAGVRNDRERNATAGKRGLGLRTMDRTTVRHQTTDGAGRKRQETLN